MNKEILLVVEAVSNEKGVAREVIFQAIEAALAMATRKKTNDTIDVQVVIDRKSGDYQTFRRWQILDDASTTCDTNMQILLAAALAKNPALQVGDYYLELIESVEFGRIAAQKAKQVIIQKVLEAERLQIVQAYKNKINQLISGIVRKTTRDFVIVDLGNNVEALLSRVAMLPHEALRVGDRVRALLYEIRPDVRNGPQIMLSRVLPAMLVELFKLEVPEVGEELIEVKAAARDPGIRAKIAVKTNDGRIDPIGACVGMRGSRVQAVSSELGGERIDIILWDDNPAQLVINAMAPAEVASIIVDEDTHTMDVAVKAEQLSQAIGRNGQNVRLASELTGWTINVMTEEQAILKAAAEDQKVIDAFTEKLGITDSTAALLAAEGFAAIEEIAYVPDKELLSIPGMTAAMVAELRDKAKAALLTKALAAEQELEQNQPAADLLAMENLEKNLAFVLAKHGIITREDLAEQSVDDLLLIPGIDAQQAADLIMTARKIWFDS